eukprot:12235737-Heterocapsa_arctica.AAC.2
MLGLRCLRQNLQAPTSAPRRTHTTLHRRSRSCHPTILQDVQIVTIDLVKLPRRISSRLLYHVLLVDWISRPRVDGSPSASGERVARAR